MRCAPNFSCVRANVFLGARSENGNKTGAERERKRERKIAKRSETSIICSEPTKSVVKSRSWGLIASFKWSRGPLSPLEIQTFLFWESGGALVGQELRIRASRVSKRRKNILPPSYCGKLGNPKLENQTSLGIRNGIISLDGEAHFLGLTRNT